MSEEPLYSYERGTLGIGLLMSEVTLSQGPTAIAYERGSPEQAGEEQLATLARTSFLEWKEAVVDANRSLVEGRTPYQLAVRALSSSS